MVAYRVGSTASYTNQIAMRVHGAATGIQNVPEPATRLLIGLAWSASPPLPQDQYVLEK